MIPRTAQDLAIEHRTRRLPGRAFARATDRPETLRQLYIGRECREHPMFLAALEHPPHGIRPADQRRPL